MVLVSLGHASRLFLTLILISSAFLVSCHLSTKWRELPDDNARKEAVQKAIGAQEWDKVKSLTENQKTGLYRLLHQKALAQTEDWDALISTPSIADPRFQVYDRFLRQKAHFELGQFDQLQAPSSSIPPPLAEEMLWMQAKAYYQQENYEKAEQHSKDLMKEFPRSNFRQQVRLQLANIYWEQGKQEEAIDIYGELYRRYPTEDFDELVSERLVEADKLYQLDSKHHLDRIKVLERSAFFQRALEELSQLKQELTEKTSEEIRLATASVKMAQRQYQQAEDLARTALQRTLKPEHQQKWKSLLALSLTRQGQYEQAREFYRELLQQKLDARKSQEILLRLGLMAIDDERFEEATGYFQTLQTEYPNGRFQESAHWFGAWALYQSGEDHHNSIDLLEALPSLPQGKSFTPQSLYWKAQNYLKLENKALYQETIDELKDDWGASFYARLTEPDPFRFTSFHPSHLDLSWKAPSLNPDQFSQFESLPWQRVEAFSSVRLHSWARIELDEFLKQVHRLPNRLKNEIASRLEKFQAWPNLLRFARQYHSFELKDLKPHDRTARYFYPLSHQELVMEASNEFEISPFLIWGVMREESRYQADAVSPAGAIGLLQLMPSLASRIARAQGEGLIDRQGLKDPKRNIHYGTYYLAELFQQTRQLELSPELSTVVTIASYNAGMRPVQEWLEEKDTTDIAHFVESIPYSETRRYVKRVLQSTFIYSYLYGPNSQNIASKKEDDSL